MNKRYKTHKWTLLVLLAALGLFLPLPLAEGGDSASKSHSAKANILSPLITATVNNILGWGSIVPGTCSGLVIVETVLISGKATGRCRTTKNSIFCFGRAPTACGSFLRGELTVSGSANTSYNITIVDTAGSNACIFLTTTCLTVTSYSSYSLGSGGATATGTLNSSGTDTVFLGATASVPASAVSGTYITTADISINYF